jgi:hypothetical protein
VGKSTIFNLLTHGHVETSSWGHARGEAHIGIARVPDPRLDRLAAITRPRKVTHATVEYVDLPGLAKGEGRTIGAREMGSYLASLKNVDALAHVVRAFEDVNVPHPEGTVDPGRDISLFELEMIFSDLAIVENRLERLARDLKKARSQELELEHAMLERAKAFLDLETPLRDIQMTEDERRRIRGFTFLSAKPMLLILNLDDRDTAKISRPAEAFGLEKHAGRGQVGLTAVCGKIESELAALPEEEAAPFLADFGLAEGGAARIIHESYSMLGLTTFYTISEPEAHAWAVGRDATALQAAGVIHSDFERGFIKAEVVSYEDMVRLGSFQAARNGGVLHLEGKDYPVRDGDVILFRFNV